ncbi:3-hydroxyacyl-ACP dehydratase FabZ [Blattabacterium cuenoti]|uniref:3-hydroxyacyl-ACP dehydratase FabZ n=1 Tax=Blattabacterium cuenoti TaxID=1653831 RepID=UPI00163D23D8|nr:3-hydroxyacyl-ACP dehydratase FabZ [Blattabacterium cuenoti]
MKIFKKKNIHEWNQEKDPIFDITKIMNILPHKPPFLLVDKIIDISDQKIVGVKNVTINEFFFTNHFPEEPIMPGVLQIEAIAQVGGILVLSKFRHPRLYGTYFLKIEKAKFKHKIIPGDVIIFKVCLLNAIRMGIVHMKGEGYVSNKLAVEAEFMAKIVRKNRLFIR